MWKEVYYKNYADHCRDRYWEEEKLLPFSVKCRSNQEKKTLEALLRFDGFKCVGGSQCLGLLINLRLLRYCSYPMPVQMPCIDNRSFSTQSFLAGVYHPWHENRKYGVKLEEIKAFQQLRENSFIAYCRRQGVTDEELIEKLSRFS